MGNQINWGLLVISSACFVSLFCYLDLVGRVKALNQIPLKVLRVIRTPGISDHWKEKVLLVYARQLLLQSLTIFTLLLGALSPFFVSFLLSALFGGHFISQLLSLSGIAVSTVSAVLFGLYLSKNSGEDYSVSSKLLHQIVLGTSFFGETLFDIEKILHGSSARDVSREKHVFVAGLARAGTTILMRTLYENGNFLSLTYRDMPFILAPNSWRACSKKFSRKGQKQQRAHGDGIEVDYDSPEALEEVFWRTFCRADYIKKDSLIPMKASAETLENFKSFISIILQSEPEKRYLSKNNNNILRLSSISEAFPDAIIIVPFRDPLQQAFSLRGQHRKFVGEGDPFTKKYMTWLGHHEFGADQRPFVFTGKVSAGEDTDDLNYWLRLWISTYSSLLDTIPSGAVFLSYEALCDNTQNIWQQLSEKIELEPCKRTINFSKSHRQIDEAVTPELLMQASEIYQELMCKSIGC
jgi:Sulfotransferase family